ncbi:hypothetical protein [Empedobacter brevis]|uniref:hypothetical protein n=1 Tax=Empedobacter brevis TaxID=247 RepID=UPI00289BE675|nr:hypothetical protein [Empedobacter brevis]
MKFSLEGYKNRFFEGISIAKTPKQAEEQALKLIKKRIDNQNPEMTGLYDCEVTKCTKLRTDFIIDSDKN